MKVEFNIQKVLQKEENMVKYIKIDLILFIKIHFIQLRIYPVSYTHLTLPTKA